MTTNEKLKEESEIEANKRKWKEYRIKQLINNIEAYQFYIRRITNSLHEIGVLITKEMALKGTGKDGERNEANLEVHHTLSNINRVSKYTTDSSIQELRELTAGKEKSEK